MDKELIIVNGQAKSLESQYAILEREVKVEQTEDLPEIKISQPIVIEDGETPPDPELAKSIEAILAANEDRLGDLRRRTVIMQNAKLRV